MNRRSALCGLIAMLVAPSILLGFCNTCMNLMVIERWDDLRGHWERCRMKDLHAGERFRMSYPNGDSYQNGEVYLSVSEPYLTAIPEVGGQVWGVDGRVCPWE